MDSDMFHSANTDATGQVSQHNPAATATSLITTMATAATSGGNYSGAAD